MQSVNVLYGAVDWMPGYYAVGREFDPFCAVLMVLDVFLLTNDWAYPGTRVLRENWTLQGCFW